VAHVVLLRLPGVYAPQGDTWLLARAMLRHPRLDGARVLDLCSGSGVLALAAHAAGAQVTAVDISWQAVLSTRLNAALSGARVRVLRGDLVEPVLHDRFDLVLANPPYVPRPEGVRGGRGRARAWDGGPDGRAVLDRLCRTAPALLRTGGTLLMVHSGLCGTGRTLAALSSQGLDVVVAERHSVPFGPVMRDRAAALESTGAIPCGRQHEELVVVRAERR
jgi:release factor glutamine methyltransferase